MAGDAPSDPLAFARLYGPTALILGGSEGIGRSFADQLAAAGFDLVLVARNAATLEAAAGEIAARHGVRVATQAIDLTGPDMEQAVGQLLAAHEIGLVVYNAGATHGAGRFLDDPLDKAANLVRLNCLGPVTVAHHALSAMRARGRGGMIVISSMSGMSGAGLVAAYAAGKSFEIVLCEGLHRELAAANVDILCAVAGLTDTPAMVRSGMKLSEGGYTPMDPADVARGALAQLGRTAVWYAVGQPAADAMRAMPRDDLVTSMTEATAALYGVSLD